ncbi:hypothetical protein L2X99_03115 [Microbacterium sp. KUDC0406]|uniref:hypothetical protein n=1 Tax=Microbacterium sp. KUDC0406 TaxID=2909588 RepID=UPI001F45B2C7|nr:hypothetical protein [Microbacterium sp. KUDC0406]UJP10673.1 hypothetical protein L2X99_03115 [Microbacterium sp. KUDC0406]
MILAGLLLFAVGAVDLVRQFVPASRRWVGYVVAALALFLIGSFCDAAGYMLAAAAGAVAWLLSMPDQPERRQGFWPAVLLAVASVVSVVVLGDRAPVGWALESPFGRISPDLAVLALGIVVFLLESGNVVVRAALAGEHTWKPTAEEGGFKGGRLIGPLERMLAFLLMLVPAYSLLAALLAAKGIVRFPEISKDGETGARAEYFLVGSLVSWAMALGGALLVWWAANV